MKNLTVLLLCLFFIGSSSSLVAQCDIEGPSSFEEGNEVTYDTDDSGNASYFWSVTGVLNLVGGNTSSSINVDADEPGTGSVCVTRFEAGEEPCCSCIEVEVTEEVIEPPCIPATSVSVSQIEISGNGCPGDIIDFEAIVQPGNATIQPGSFYWEAGTDFVISNPFFQQTGNNKATIDTPAGENSIWVRVTFTSCDGTQVTGLTLAIWEFGCFKLTPVIFKGSGSIAPNPFTDNTQLHFAAEESTDAQLVIYNVSGQLVYSRAVSFTKGKNVLSLDDLPEQESGLLYYQIVNEKEILANGKMLKQE